MTIDFIGMRTRNVIRYALASVALFAVAEMAVAQEEPANRLANVVGVAIGEYSKGVDEHGRLTSAQEYQETLDFLVDAESIAQRLTGTRAVAVRAVLDTIALAVRAKVPPPRLDELHNRFVAALGDAAKLDLPTQPLSVADGRAVYEGNCASCHGARGLGDGPAAKGLDPAPPAIGAAGALADASPALLYRAISAGVPGTSMPAWGGMLTPQQRWNALSYVQSLRTSPEQVADGRRLFLQRCPACTGGGLAPNASAAASDSAVARVLSRLPADIASFDWLSHHSDRELGQAISAGAAGAADAAGTRLPAGAHAPGDSDVASMVAYVRTLPVALGGALGPPPTPDSGSAIAAQTVVAMLDQALAAARAGQPDEAHDRAFDAYIAFEPLETPARAKSPGVVAAMEHRFADFKAQITQRDLHGARNTRDAIEASLPSVVALTQRTSGAWEAFLQSLLIILREGFEAILVIGAIVAFLIKTGNRDRLRAIWIGAGLGVAASALTAVILQTALRAVPASRDLIEGISMLAAVVVLFWVSYWLISKVEAAKWQTFIRHKVAGALAAGGGKALALVAFLAVYREGAETALFYQALFGEGAHLVVPLSLGIGCGAIALAVIFTLFYRYGVKIPLRPFFTITSALLYYMAFVFMGKGIRELQEVNVVPITVLHGFPHVEAMGIYATLETSGAQLLLIVLLAIALAKTFWPLRAMPAPTGRGRGKEKGAGDAPTSPIGARTRRTARRSRGGATQDTSFHPRDRDAPRCVHDGTTPHAPAHRVRRG